MIVLHKTIKSLRAEAASPLTSTERTSTTRIVDLSFIESKFDLMESDGVSFDHTLTPTDANRHTKVEAGKDLKCVHV